MPASGVKQALVSPAGILDFIKDQQ